MLYFFKGIFEPYGVFTHAPRSSMGLHMDFLPFSFFTPLNVVFFLGTENVVGGGWVWILC